MTLRRVISTLPLLTGLALCTPASALPMSPSAIAPPAPLTAVRLVCRHGQCYRVSRRHSYRRAYRSYARPRYEGRRYYSEEAYPRPQYYREQTEFRGYREDGPRFGYQERQFVRPDVGVRLQREREEDED